MNAKKRYALVLTSVAFLAFCYYGGHRLKDKKSTRWKATLSRSSSPEVLLGGNVIHSVSSHLPIETRPLKIQPEPSADFVSDDIGGDAAQQRRTSSSLPNLEQKCTMQTCFNLSRCQDRPFKVYVYPLDEHVPPSESYSKILNSLTESNYYTSDPDEACLFVLSLDTLDRDQISNYAVRNMPSKIAKLEHWNGGLNHVIFNLYSGTFPDYTEDLRFNAGKAILAKASSSDEHYRPGFDVSIPLFHKNHPERGGEPGRLLVNNFPVSEKYFLAFKGKRYVYGIGSETRNSLYHLHNGKNLVLVTTCRHGNWREYKDDRCDNDNREFDRWDYDDLLANSTFCLVPRGRRLGSYRFIETLQAGCVPVLLSNGWRLPFAEVIDWSQATLQADERLLLQVPDLLYSVPQSKVFAMRQQTQILWDRYLSSVEKIVHTTFEIIRERIYPHNSRDGYIWNSDPGALLTPTTFSDSVFDFPFEFAQCPPASPTTEASHSKRGCDKFISSGIPEFPKSRSLPRPLTSISTNSSNEKFTAVIYTQLSSPVVHLGAPIFKLVRNVAASKHVQQIVVHWTSPVSPPPLAHWPGMRSGRVPIHVILAFSNATSPSIRFRPNSYLTTSAILSLDDDSSLTTDEIDFAFSVWKSFPERIVGFPARSHFWDERRSAWAYTSKWTNEYSMVLTGAAFLHRYYFHLYTEYLPHRFLDTVDQFRNCEDILMNFLVSHVTKRPPIKVTQRKNYKEKTSPGVTSPWTNPDHFNQRQTCMNTFVEGFGYNPLLKSVTRLDPILFKDPVSSFRKKYRKLELVTIATGSQ